MEAAKEVVAFLMPRGPYAKYTTKTGVETFTAEDADEIQVPSATLVNSRTAGEAELLPGFCRTSARPWSSAPLRREKTRFRSWSRSNPINRPIRITVGTLSLVQSGSSWQDTGIQPGRTVEMPEELAPYAALLTDDEDPQILAAGRYWRAVHIPRLQRLPTRPIRPPGLPVPM